jgi:hypothetical protein
LPLGLQGEGQEVSNRGLLPSSCHCLFAADASDTRVYLLVIPRYGRRGRTNGPIDQTEEPVTDANTDDLNSRPHVGTVVGDFVCISQTGIVSIDPPAEMSGPIQGDEGQRIWRILGLLIPVDLIRRNLAAKIHDHYCHLPIIPSLPAIVLRP